MGKFIAVAGWEAADPGGAAEIERCSEPACCLALGCVGRGLCSVASAACLVVHARRGLAVSVPAKATGKRLLERMGKRLFLEMAKRP
jgi:hypothetical protein